MGVCMLDLLICSLYLLVCRMDGSRELFVRKTIKYCEFCHDVVSTVLSYIAAFQHLSKVVRSPSLIVVAIGFSSTGMIFTVGCRFLLLLMFLDV